MFTNLKKRLDKPRQATNENAKEKIMSTTELTEQPLAYKIIELTVVLVVYCLKFLSLMQDDFVEGARDV